MATVTYTGTVSAQAGPGETVTVTVTPSGGGTPKQVTGPTDSGGNYSITDTENPGVGYSAIASIPADSKFKAATSAPVTFDVLGDRTISLSVTVS